MEHKCGKNMGNDLLVIPCDLPTGHTGQCERNNWPVPPLTQYRCECGRRIPVEGQVIGKQLEASRRLTCCCCGEYAGNWKQHWNRDTGYGICKPCVERIRKHRPFGHEPMSEAEISSLYGTEGVNWGQM